jgi:hypothetical protein
MACARRYFKEAEDNDKEKDFEPLGILGCFICRSFVFAFFPDFAGVCPPKANSSCSHLMASCVPTFSFFSTKSYRVRRADTAPAADASAHLFGFVELQARPPVIMGKAKGVCQTCSPRCQPFGNSQNAKARF